MTAKKGKDGGNGTGRAHMAELPIKNQYIPCMVGMHAPCVHGIEVAARSPCKKGERFKVLSSFSAMRCMSRSQLNRREEGSSAQFQGGDIYSIIVRRVTA